MLFNLQTKITFKKQECKRLLSFQQKLFSSVIPNADAPRIYSGSEIRGWSIFFRLNNIVKRLGLGLGTWDLGPGTWDLGPGTWE